MGGASSWPQASIGIARAIITASRIMFLILIPLDLHPRCRQPNSWQLGRASQIEVPWRCEVTLGCHGFGVEYITLPAAAILRPTGWRGQKNGATISRSPPPGGWAPLRLSAPDGLLDGYSAVAGSLPLHFPRPGATIGTASRASVASGAIQAHYRTPNAECRMLTADG